MGSNTAVKNIAPQLNKYKISRRGRKLQVSDDPRTLLALPREVPERTWAEILQKEENELICFDIREEILEEALRIGYEHYMEKQNALFTVHCAAQAWLKLIDWNFYRHDPGEDPSSYPPCYIPKRLESWNPDEIPDPSPKDTWGRQELVVIEECPDEPLPKCPSSTSLDYPVVEEIPEQCRFPGKVQLEGLPTQTPPVKVEIPRPVEIEQRIAAPQRQASEMGSGESSRSMSLLIGDDSEMVQKVTDYNGPPVSYGHAAVKLGAKSSKHLMDKPPKKSSVDGSLRGAGDSTVVDAERRSSTKRRSRQHQSKSQGWSRPSSMGKSRGVLPPLLADSLSAVSVISDCRLRNLRLDTQFEVSPERVETPVGEQPKRK